MSSFVAPRADQKNYLYLHDYLDDSLLPLLLSYLVTFEKVNCAMPSVQIFQITLVFIASSKSWNRGLHFQKHRGLKLSDEELSLNKLLFLVVRYDSSSHLNLT